MSSKIIKLLIEELIDKKEIESREFVRKAKDKNITSIRCGADIIRYLKKECNVNLPIKITKCERKKPQRGLPPNKIVLTRPLTMKDITLAFKEVNIFKTCEDYIDWERDTKESISNYEENGKPLNNIDPYSDCGTADIDTLDIRRKIRCSIR